MRLKRPTDKFDMLVDQIKKQIGEARDYLNDMSAYSVEASAIATLMVHRSRLAPHVVEVLIALLKDLVDEEQKGILRGKDA